MTTPGAWTCTVPGCDRAGHALALCERHYGQLRSGRDPHAEARGDQFHTLKDAAVFIERSGPAVRGWISKGLLPDGPPWYPLDLVRARDAAVARRAAALVRRGFHANSIFPRQQASALWQPHVASCTIAARY